MWSLFRSHKCHYSILFQYNICTCGAKSSPVSSSSSKSFQYNICTCGAVSYAISYTCYLYFNTTFVHVEHTFYSIIKCTLSYFNTTFVHVELKHFERQLVAVTLFQYNICTCGAFHPKLVFYL